MSIENAKLLVKIQGKRNWITEDDRRDLCHQMVSTFGYKTFGYGYCCDSKTEGGMKHCPIEILRSMENYELDPRNWHNPNPDSIARYERNRKKVAWPYPLFNPESYFVFAEPDEQFLEVNLRLSAVWEDMVDWYGEWVADHWRKLCAIAEFLEQQIPNSQIWYDDEFDNVRPYRFDAKARESVAQFCKRHETDEDMIVLADQSLGDVPGNSWQVSRRWAEVIEVIRHNDLIAAEIRDIATIIHAWDNKRLMELERQEATTETAPEDREPIN